jgi:hypothetical protein
VAVTSQNKRKTNHELLEEDHNKLAIGYRLSAIGYRLTLGVLVSVFAVTAFAADCKVNDSDISGDYVGGCVNGLAHGKGKAKGKDTYEGEFKLGNKSGKGTYIWEDGGKYSGAYLDDKEHGKGTSVSASGEKYDGDWLNGKRSGSGVLTWSDGRKYDGNFENSKRTGFGIFRTPKNAFVKEKHSNLGEWVGEVYVEKGYFSGNGFQLPCSSAIACKQEQAKREAQERREAAERESRERDRVANACNNFYQGKSIGFKPAGWSYFGSVLDAVVLGKGNGNVSIKIVDRHFADDYGKTLEMSCTSNQLQ